MGSCGEVGWLWFPKDERSKGEKGGSEMVGVLGSLVLEEQKPRTPRGQRLCFKKKYKKWGLWLLWLKREHDNS